MRSSASTSRISWFVTSRTSRRRHARRASTGIRTSVDIDTPRLVELLKVGVTLATDVTGTDERVDAVVPRLAKLLSGIEVLPPEVDRCLRCAIARAHGAGLADRAARIEMLVAAVPPPRS